MSAFFCMIMLIMITGVKYNFRHNIILIRCPHIKIPSRSENS
jgi:hypothetical protein